MRKSKSRRKKKKPQSINFADSLASKKDVKGINAPEYSVTGEHAEQEQAEAFETDGSITFYCNGFLPERDYLGNETREQNEKNDPDGNGEKMHQDESTIEGGESYWGDMDEKLEERFTGKEPQADSTFYFDGSAGPLSSASDRMKYGESAALSIIKQVESGKFELDENGLLPDAINVVGHSMGAAYAAGLARGLLRYNEEQGKKVFNVRSVYYFAPHQPMDIEHPSEIRGVQYSHKNDSVSSNGDSKEASALWGLLPKGTGSSLAPISGIHEFMVHDVPGLDGSLLGDRGGHNVSDHDYTLDKYKKDRDGYIAPNADSDYDTENYKHQTVSNEGYEKPSIHLPKLIDKLEGLPADIRNKIDEIQSWLGENVSDANSIFKEKVGQGQEWLDEKRQSGKDWIDEKINEGDVWVDDKIDKGNDKIDEQIDKGTDWLNKKSGGLLGEDIGKLSDWVRGKKNKGVNKVKKKEDRIVDFSKDKVNEANEWLGSKTSDLSAWVTEKSDGLASYVNKEVEQISIWAKAQVSKGEKYAQRMAKSLQRKLKSLILKIQRKIQAIRNRIRKIILIIKETEAWA